MKIGYARVSTQSIKLILQIDALKKVGCKKIYREQASVAKSERPQLEKLKAHVRKGDRVII